MIYLSILLIVVLFAIAVWNQYTLRQHLKIGGKTMEGENYIELKYKMEFLTASFWVMVSVGGLLGYNSLQGVSESIQKELQTKLDSVSVKLVEQGKEIEVTNKTIADYKEFVENIKEDVPAVENLMRDLTTLKTTINNINNKNILRQSYYIVNLPTKVDPNNTINKICFEDLRTNFGDHLPIFKSPPIVIPVTNNQGGCIVFSITKDCFKMEPTFNAENVVNVSYVIIENN